MKNMKGYFVKRYRHLSILSLLIIGLAVNIGSIDDGGSDNDKDINGVWEYKTVATCNGHAYEFTDEYLNISDRRFRSYKCFGDDCYFCSSHDEVAEEEISMDNIDVDGDQMTITVGEYCESVMTLERASESDIAGALDDCSMMTED